MLKNMMTTEAVCENCEEQAATREHPLIGNACQTCCDEFDETPSSDWREDFHSDI